MAAVLPIIAIGTGVALTWYDATKRVNNGVYNRSMAHTLLAKLLKHKRVLLKRAETLKKTYENVQKESTELDNRITQTRKLLSVTYEGQTNKKEMLKGLNNNTTTKQLLEGWKKNKQKGKNKNLAGKKAQARAAQKKLREQLNEFLSKNQNVSSNWENQYAKYLANYGSVVTNNDMKRLRTFRNKVKQVHFLAKMKKP